LNGNWGLKDVILKAEDMSRRDERTLHAEWLCWFFVALRTIEERRAPIVMANWYKPTINPRIAFGEHSDWYMGTRQLTAPTIQKVSREYMKLGACRCLLATNTSNDAAYYESGPVSVKLESNTQAEDDASRDETPFTANHITEGEREKCPEKCTGG
jgi:hypothetical protein